MSWQGRNAGKHAQMLFWSGPQKEASYYGRMEQMMTQYTFLSTDDVKHVCLQKGQKLFARVIMRGITLHVPYIKLIIMHCRWLTKHFL